MRDYTFKISFAKYFSLSISFIPDFFLKFINWDFFWSIYFKSLVLFYRYINSLQNLNCFFYLLWAYPLPYSLHISAFSPFPPFPFLLFPLFYPRQFNFNSHVTYAYIILSIYIKLYESQMRKEAMFVLWKLTDFAHIAISSCMYFSFENDIILFFIAELNSHIYEFSWYMLIKY